MSYTYGSIKTKIRNITGRKDTDQLSEDELGSYIDNFYTITMPNSLKTDEMLQPYSFNTTEGVDEYDFPTSTFYTLEPDARYDGNRMFWYYDINLFNTDYPKQIQEEDLADGDGVTTAFSGILEDYPIIKGTVLIYDGIEIFSDNGDGTLTGSAGGSGTIDYSTGAYSVTFNVAPSSTTTVETKYEPTTYGSPVSILDYNKKLVIRPVPDGLYNIAMQGYIKPSSLSNDSDVPFSDSLAPLVIYGTSLEIFSENGDMDHYNMYYPIYLKYLDVALDKTTQNLSKTRSVPSW